VRSSAVLAVVLAAGCAENTRHVKLPLSDRDRTEIERRVEGREIYVSYRPSAEGRLRRERASEFMLGIEEARWYLLPAEREVVVPLSSVRSIEYRVPVDNGAAIGFGLGAAAGITVGLLIGMAATPAKPCPLISFGGACEGPSALDAQLMGTSAGFGIGSLIGVLVGAASATPHRIELTP
jgi:hypothetical protein